MAEPVSHGGNRHFSVLPGGEWTHAKNFHKFSWPACTHCGNQRHMQWWQLILCVQNTQFNPTTKQMTEPHCKTLSWPSESSQIFNDLLKKTFQWSRCWRKTETWTSTLRVIFWFIPPCFTDVMQGETWEGGAILAANAEMEKEGEKPNTLGLSWRKNEENCKHLGGKVKESGKESRDLAKIGTTEEGRSYQRNAWDGVWEQKK